MLTPILLTIIYLSAIVVQLLVEGNFLGPVEIFFGLGILLYAAFVRPREEEWTKKILLYLLAIVLLFAVLLLERSNVLLINSTIFILVELGIALLLVRMGGDLLRTRVRNEWQEKLKQVAFFTGIALVLAMIAYNPFSDRLVIPLAGFLGHMVLGAVYFLAFTWIDRYSEQQVLQVDPEQWLYRQSDEK